ncbi:MAG: carboxymuconolactone decarboxylase family protein [Enhydrobacter sp.]
MFRLTALTLASTLVLIVPAGAQSRLPDIPPAQYDADQKKAAEEFQAARKAPLSGPFQTMMYSPEVMSRARAMGDYLRFHSAIGNTLSELVILITARAWSQGYEWSAHQPLALKAGISKDTVDAIAEGRRPASMSDDEAIAYDFTMELQYNKGVSDTTYAKAEKRWGKKGAVDIAGISGYYTFLALQLNMARQPVPANAPLLPRLPN